MNKKTKICLPARHSPPTKWCTVHPNFSMIDSADRHNPHRQFFQASPKRSRSFFCADRFGKSVAIIFRGDLQQCQAPGNFSVGSLERRPDPSGFQIQAVHVWFCTFLYCRFLTGKEGRTLLTFSRGVCEHTFRLHKWVRVPPNFVSFSHGLGLCTLIISVACAYIYVVHS